MASPAQDAPAPALAGRPSVLRALGGALRPRQWTKNGALLAALVFAQKLRDLGSVERALLGVAAFCLLASATYLGNDVADRDADRLHPVKSHRAVAAGLVTVPLALLVAGALAAAGLVLAALLGRGFFACAGGYLVLQALYTAWLKHLVVVDVFAIAAGFVLRVVAGAEAIHVPISNWLYLCTLLLSLFLALGKRRAELVLLEGGAAAHRKILAEYSLGLVDQLITVVSACTVLAYALYTLSADTVQKFGTDRLKLTVPFVLFGLFRYLYLVRERGEGGQPEKVLLGDRPTQVNLLFYLATVGWALYTRP